MNTFIKYNNRERKFVGKMSYYKKWCCKGTVIRDFDQPVLALNEPTWPMKSSIFLKISPDSTTLHCPKSREISRDIHNRNVKMKTWYWPGIVVSFCQEMRFILEKSCTFRSIPRFHFYTHDFWDSVGIQFFKVCRKPGIQFLRYTKHRGFKSAKKYAWCATHKTFYFNVIFSKFFLSFIFHS